MLALTFARAARHAVPGSLVDVLFFVVPFSLALALQPAPATCPTPRPHLVASVQALVGR
jgi:hypothetical protein